MQSLTRLEGLDLSPLRPTPRSQRSSSISNDRASLSVASLPCPPAVKPDPAYIAPSSASQLVTGDHEPTLEEEDDEEGMNGSGSMNAWVAPNALHLVNAFLDQLLYSFLASSRSTAIASLRPALTEVLKPRLAKDAIASADAELQEFLGDEDYDELSVFQHGIEPRGNWDLNLIWRRTRLRCMVYTRLGDLEEEDEEMWIERENVGHKVDGRNRLSRDLGVVSPTSAIFLTSILEFIGEEILRVSGKAAYTRFEARRRQGKASLANALDERLSVEVVDIEKLAVNTTFGRLWRSWKKKVRSPSITSQRPPSREFLLRPASSLSSGEPRSRKASMGDNGAPVPDAVAFRRPCTAEDRERTSEAAAVPLPVSRHDANGTDSHGASTWTSRPGLEERPRSMMIGSDANHTASQTDDAYAADTSSGRPGLLHNRSSSLPHLALRQFPSVHTSFFSARQEVPSLIASQHSPSGFPRHDSNPAAVSTMYDGVIDRNENTRGVGGDQAMEQPHLAAQEKEMQDIDYGIDSLAKGSNKHQPIKEQDSSTTATTATGNDYKNDRHQLPVADPTAVPKSFSIDGQDDRLRLNEQLPLRTESRLDSERMQGYTNENAPLDDRETSIVKSALSHGYGNKSIASQVISDGNASHFKHREDEDVSAAHSGPISHTNQHQSNGTNYATRDYSAQHYGAVPRSHPDADTVSDSLPIFTQSKVPTKVSDIRKQLPPVSTGVERAAVQRMSPSPGSAIESPVGRTSTSSSRELRALHTSGSISSQKAGKIKGLVGRESSDTNRQFAVSRTSSEGSGSIAIKTPRVDEAQQSFEQLIKSDETIQYTLTPRSVREMDSPDSPRYSQGQTGTAELADFIRTSGPPPTEATRPSTRRSIVSLKGLEGLRSNPAPLPTLPPTLEKPKTETQRSRHTIAKSPGAPRDTQNTESTRDFADFIRSTGPEEKPGPSQRDGAALPPNSGLRPNKAMTPGHRSISGLSIGKKITKPQPSLSKSPPPATNNPPPERTASRLQAREATYQPTHNEDLLDFLKEGPMDDRGNERRPIPGPVATIVQNPYVPGNIRPRTSDNTRSSVASTQGSSYANHSIRSANSRTGLLDSPRAQDSRSPPSQRQAPFGESARKQRRIRDPYAIDTDSEDDDAGTPKPKRQGQPESLIDLLNSTPPPDTNPRIPSAFDDMPIPSGRSYKVNGNMPKNTSSQPSARAAAPPGIIRSAAPPAPTSNPQPPRGRPPNQTPPPPPPQLPPLNSRDISPHLTSTYTSTSPPAATNGASEPRQQRSRPIKPPGVARAEPEPQRGMGDLADFLRNSEPPTQIPDEFRGKTEEEKVAGGSHGIWGKLKGRGRKGVK